MYFLHVVFNSEGEAFRWDVTDKILTKEELDQHFKYLGNTGGNEYYVTFNLKERPFDLEEMQKHFQMFKAIHDAGTNQSAELINTIVCGLITIGSMSASATKTPRTI